VPPRKPAQGRAAGADARRGIEVLAGREHQHRTAVERDTNECRDGLASRLGVVLPDADELPVSAVQREVAIAERPRGCQRRGRGLAFQIQGIYALIAEVDEVDVIAVHEVGATAVLVHSRTRVEPGRRDVARRAGRGMPDEDVAPALLRTPFDPIDVVTGESDAA